MEVLPILTGVAVTAACDAFVAEDERLPLGALVQNSEAMVGRAGLPGSGSGLAAPGDRPASAERPARELLMCTCALACACTVTGCRPPTPVTHHPSPVTGHR